MNVGLQASLRYDVIYTYTKEIDKYGSCNKPEAWFIQLIITGYHR